MALNWILAAAISATLLGGCATTSSSRTGTSQESRNPVIVQAGEKARAAAALTGSARSDVDREIERLLASLDNATLSREAATLAAGDPLYNYAGQALIRRGLPLPRPFDRSGWNFDAANRPPADSDGYRPPVKLAVLLPMSGNIAVAATPVRDGFLAGYYGETRRRPDVNFYDTAGTPGGALAAYDRATAEGNDFVVGPLGRDEVNALFAKGQLQVPVLALNRGDAVPPHGNASFSLSPEDEGIAAAEHLLGIGARRILVIAATDESQQRAVTSLRERLVGRGAEVTDVVSEGVSDFAPYAQKAGGVDAVFLAVKGSSARLLMPKLAVAGLAGKPRVATSQLLSGTGKPEEDRVLDGIAFPSEVWTTRGVHGLPPAAMVGTQLNSTKGPAARLFAFGFDAWQITAYLQRLATGTDGRIDGATGQLRLDGFGNVQRTPAWSTFSAGVATPLPDAARR